MGSNLSLLTQWRRLKRKEKWLIEQDCAHLEIFLHISIIRLFFNAPIRRARISRISHIKLVPSQSGPHACDPTSDHQHHDTRVIFGSEMLSKDCGPWPPGMTLQKLYLLCLAHDLRIPLVDLWAGALMPFSVMQALLCTVFRAICSICTMASQDAARQS